ncbi:uncharacterized protein LOC123310405 [Coccinella septempunctata]|uniref:uncharacterized protein LOC123310405 n=1 Tax=Coccinella septempunctata TaxID=41139 RepID=UPI001D076C86|nr:uncharacterized protein LOC123310405 [Coccinella septempunctata]
MFFNILILCATCAWAYVEKDDILPELFLEQLADRIQRENDISYLDITNPNSLGPRSLEEERYDPLDYDLGDAPLHPSIRDQEYLKHSSLWSSKYALEDTAGDDDIQKQHSAQFATTTKPKNTLPAYCNPPNPCPVGFGGEEGCMEDFENTAAFSRRFQEVQDCMCDAEHMFDCPDNSDPFLDNSMDEFSDFEFNHFVRQQMQDNSLNPFLFGERLPVAAKKGNRVQ